MALTEKELEEARKLGKGLSGLELQIPVEAPGPYPPGPTPPTFTDYAVQALPEMGAMLGSALMGRVKGPATLAQMGLRSMTGAGVGGGLGEATRQAYEGVKSEVMPPPLPTQFSKIGMSAVENAALDAAGNLVFNLAGKSYRVGKDFLTSTGFLKTAAPNDYELKSAIQNLLESEGASLTRFQAEPTAVRKTSESIARSSITGQSIFRRQEEIVNQALQKSRDNILTSITDAPESALRTGQEYLKVIESADKALGDAVRPFYQSLSDKGGNVLVNMGPIKTNAAEALKKAEKLTETGDASTILGADVARELRNLSGVVSDISFADAHQFRSILNARLRALKAEVGADTPVTRELSIAVKSLDDQMDKAAKELNPTLLQEYRATSQKYRESITELYPAVLQNIIQKTPERIGESVFKSGNVSEIREVYKALARAKNLNPTLDTGKLRKDFQRGFVESFLSEEGVEITSQSLANLSKKLKDPKFKRTFSEALDPQQQNSIKLLIEAGKTTSERPGAALSLLVAGQQAQAISLLAGIGTYAAGADALVASMVGAGVLFTPRVLAKMSTDPKAVRKILQIDQEVKKQGLNGGKVAQIVQIFREAGVTSDDYQKAVVDYENQKQKQQETGLSVEELEELQKVFQ
jgi:hypothetical protein